MTELCDHEEEYFDDVDQDEPVDGVCFHILTEFNLNHQGVKRKLQNKTRKVYFEPQATHPQAMTIADSCATAIQKQFKGSSIKRVDPMLRNDEFHLYVVDQTHTTIAKIGVIVEDYRDYTIH